MKKLFFILVLFSFHPFDVGCQNQIGFKGGYNFFSIWDNKENKGPNYKVIYDPNKYSYAASFMFIAPIDTGVFLRIQIDYISYDFRVKSYYGSQATSFNLDYHYNIGYLNFGLMPHFEFGKKWKFFIDAGIYGAILANSNVTGKRSIFQGGYPPVNINDTINENARDHFMNYYMGVKAGIGLKIPINKKINLLIENNYSLNLESSLSSAWGSDMIRFFNSNFELGISYNIDKFRFPFKSKKK